jgi:hypothetical protein
MTAACREGERVAAAHWAVRAAEHDGDTVVAKLRAEALKRSPATRGGVYVELYKILRAATQKGGTANSGGDQRVKAAYKDGIKGQWEGETWVPCEPLRGARAVREECRASGARINDATPAAVNLVREIMKWVDGAEPRTQLRPKPNPQRAAGLQPVDWVEEICTWDRFREGLRRTEVIKGVGVDGFNAYLLRKAPEAVQREYWRDLQQCIRTQSFPTPWKERVAMLAIKPGEDPADIDRRRDLWLECHGSKLTMWMLGDNVDAHARSHHGRLSTAWPRQP